MGPHRSQGFCSELNNSFYFPLYLKAVTELYNAELVSQRRQAEQA